MALLIIGFNECNSWIHVDSRGFHTYSELAKARQQSNYGSLESRLGQDSQLPFGCCCLSLAPAEDAVATPSGHLYSRHTILKYILEKTQLLKEARIAFESQESESKAEQLLDTYKKHEEELSKFKALNEGFGSQSDDVGLKRRLDHKAMEADRRKKKTVDDRTKQEKVEELKRTSYWLPQFEPTAAARKIEKPKKRPTSPTTGKPLKLMDLTSVKLERDESLNILCAVSKKPIIHQNVVLLKTSGNIMLQSCFDELVKPTMICPITAETLSPNDILILKTGGSGFAQHNKVEAKKYRPNLM